MIHPVQQVHWDRTRCRIQIDGREPCPVTYSPPSGAGYLVRPHQCQMMDWLEEATRHLYPKTAAMLDCVISLDPMPRGHSFLIENWKFRAIPAYSLNVH
jgi:hypothetical protein